MIIKKCRSAVNSLINPEKIINLAWHLKELVQSKIRLSILGMIAIGFISASIVFAVVAGVINQTPLGKWEEYNYIESRRSMQQQVQYTAERLATLGDKENRLNNEEAFKSKVNNILEESFECMSGDCKVYLVDAEGESMAEGSYIQSIDLANAIKTINESHQNGEEDSYSEIYPVLIGQDIYYLIMEATLQPVIYRNPNGIGNVLGFLSAVGVFISILYKLSKERIDYLEYLSTCLKEIAKGNLTYEIEVIGKDELAAVAKNIMYMEGNLKKQIEEKLKIEKSKNELVSNVAHDLRTPLTSIIGYIGLVKSKTYHTSQEEEKYLNIAYEKSEKLKLLIEQLFELTKLHQQAVVLDKKSISLSNLLNQMIEELILLAEEKNIKIETHIEPTKAMISADVQKITRVFENLIENAIKYTKENQTIYVELREFKQKIYVAVSNPCENITSEEADRFFERFYRADQSRNSEIGGSGLGLAIAKNIVELHKGTICAKVQNNLISFKVGLLKDNS